MDLHYHVMGPQQRVFHKADGMMLAVYLKVSSNVLLVEPCCNNLSTQQRDLWVLLAKD